MWRKLLRISLLALLAVLPLLASESRGVVKYGGLPLPGATITATAGDKKVVAVSDALGVYSFADLADGVWNFSVSMLCFETQTREITISRDTAPAEWDLKLLPVEQIKAIAGPATPPLPSVSVAPAGTAAKNPKVTAYQRTDVNASQPAAGAAPPSDAFGSASPGELSQRANDGLLINGTSNNGAASPFAQAQAFGNNRRGFRPLYTGGIGLTLNNSALDAQQYSITGQQTPKPSFNNLTGLLSFGGPLKIPHLFENGPMFVLNYQWTRNRTATTADGLMPTEAERNGDLSSFSGVIRDPITGAILPNNSIPVSPQAQALLNLFPMPNFNGSQYNYQVPLLSPKNMDALQTRANKTIGRKDGIFGNFALLSTRADNPSIFNFLDTTDTLGLVAGINWRHNLSARLFGTFGYQYSRSSTRTKSNFENSGNNVSQNAQISGNAQDPMDLGPPTLTFSGGTSSLTDAEAQFNRNQTSALSYSLFWYHSPHNVTFGVDYRRQQANDLGQQNPRGTFAFTGAASGDDFADFLLGVPDTLALQYGNSAARYFRDNLYDAYANDDWRINPELTLNWGLRWEYGSPISEKYGNIANLDVTPNFSSYTALTGANPVANGERFPASLVEPDRHGVEPRVALAWRPISGSSMVLRAGYGVYYNTSVYSQIALQMAQQGSLGRSFSVDNNGQQYLTMQNGFTIPPSADTFGVDPNFRVGYSQNWQASVQRDLPGALVMTATYLGIKGTRGMQEFLPNTYPPGETNPCPSCQAGYIYLTSNGNSTREAGVLQLRRRLQSGFTAQLQYTFSKSIDDDAVLGGGSQIATVTSGPGGGPAAAATVTSGSSAQSAPMIAQNWLDLSAERSLSSFDQRHLLNLSLQYTTGMGLHGGTLVSGWRGALFKEWTVSTQVNAGSGLPLTPVYLAAVPGTGVTGTIRPDYTGAPLYSNSSGLALNPAAYAAPPAGQWGNAGRDSITGPAQFSLNASLGRTFRVSDRLNLDVRADSTNTLNHVTYTSWSTTIGNPLFGLPVSANAMRSLQTTVRLRF